MSAKREVKYTDYQAWIDRLEELGGYTDKMRSDFWIAYDSATGDEIGDFTGSRNSGSGRLKESTGGTLKNVKYNDLEEWKAAVKTSGGTVESHPNNYWLAYDEYDAIIGEWIKGKGQLLQIESSGYFDSNRFNEAAGGVDLKFNNIKNWQMAVKRQGATVKTIGPETNAVHIAYDKNGEEVGKFSQREGDRWGAGMLHFPKGLNGILGLESLQTEVAGVDLKYTVYSNWVWAVEKSGGYTDQPDPLRKMFYVAYNSHGKEIGDFKLVSATSGFGVGYIHFERGLMGLIKLESLDRSKSFKSFVNKINEATSKPFECEICYSHKMATAKGVNHCSECGLVTDEEGYGVGSEYYPTMAGKGAEAWWKDRDPKTGKLKKA